MKPRVAGIFAAALLAASSETAAQQFPLPPLRQPPVSLTVPQPLPPPAGPVDLYRRPDIFQKIYPQHQLPVFVYGVGGYGPGALYMPIYVAAAEETSHTRPQPPPVLGGLWLETQPGWAQVYLDGNYVGWVDDYGVRGRMLDVRAGPHRIELRAAGYVSLAFDVNVAPYQIIRYRGDLQRLDPPPSPPASNRSPAPKAVYVIANCYAGDKPPAAALPRGCDRAKLRIIQQR